jgi:hypothetical protein
MLRIIGMFVVVSTLIAGCSTGPKMQMFPDGRTYYPDWSKYDNCRINGSSADCTKNNEYVETIYPLTEEEIHYIEYENQRKRQEQREFLQSLNQALDEFNEGIKQYNKDTANAYSYQPPALGYNSFMPSNEPSGYGSSTGRTYQYDLSDPRQRALYGADPAAKLRDRIEPDVLRRNDHNMGQYGGGILRNKKGAWQPVPFD